MRSAGAPVWVQLPSLPSMLALALSFALAACSPPPAAAPDPAAAAYAPLFEGMGGEAEPRGTMAGDFAWACQAETQAEASERFEAFLASHAGEAVEMEDGFHWRRVEAAHFELVRLYYLLERTEEADALLRRLSGMP